MRYDTIPKRLTIVGDWFFILIWVVFIFHVISSADNQGSPQTEASQPTAPIEWMWLGSFAWPLIRYILIGYWIPFKDDKR